MSGWYTNLPPYETARRWGLVCKCCHEERHLLKIKRSKCIRASRRLPEARAFVAEIIRKQTQAGRSLTLADCEGVAWVHGVVSYSLRMVPEDLGQKTKHLKCVPYLISEARSAEICAECVRQLSSVPDDSADSCLIGLKRSLMEPMQVLETNCDSKKYNRPTYATRRYSISAASTSNASRRYYK